jgi:VWFA-related protein
MPLSRPNLALLLTGTIALTAAPVLARNAPSLPSSASALRLQAASSPVPTLKAKAQLVVVDVVVTDANQAPVHNLKVSDFTALDNNSAQHITGFEEHVTMAPTQAALAAAKAAAMRPLPPGLFSNFTPVPEGSAVNVLLLDALNTLMKDQAYVRDQLLAYLKNAPEGTRIAIFGLNGRLIMLQGFTSDLDVLTAAAEKSSMSPSVVLFGSGDDDPVGNVKINSITQMMGQVGGADTAKMYGNVQTALAIKTEDDVQLGYTTTMDAMEQLAHYLAGIPGRKNLIWFTGSYPKSFSPESESKYRETAKLLANSRVAIYPMGAQGVQSDARPISRDTPKDGGEAVGMGLVRYQTALAQERAVEHLAMNRIAAETGGQVYLDTNGLTAAVSQAIDNGSNYYTLSYTPTDSRQNGEFHKIQVKLAQQGLTLSYRNGYYADEPEAKSKRGVKIAATTPVQSDALSSVMMRGAPDATEIMLKLQVLPVNGAAEQDVAKGNIVNPNPAAKFEVKGPFRRYAIDIAADAKDVHITPTADGHYQFSAEVLTYVYDANSVLVNTVVQKAHGNLSASSYANMRRVGVPFHQEISVPVDGNFYLRTAVHDLETDRYGAVELPVAAVEKLTPLAASAAAPR